MKKHTILSLLTLSLFVQVAHAGNNEEHVMNSLAQDLSKRVVTITKSTFTYHWTGSADVDTQEKVNAFAENKIKNVAKRTQDSMETFVAGSTNYGLVGGGMYAARDPFSSTSYGYNNGVLIAMRLDPGARLLDIRAVNPTGVYISEPYRAGNYLWIQPSTAESLHTIGCDVTVKTPLITWLGKEKCALILGKVFKALNIVGNIHSWWGGDITGCMSNPDAFLLTDYDYLKQNGRIMAFSAASIKDKSFTDLPANDPSKSLFQVLQKLATENTNQYYHEGNGQGLASNLGISTLESSENIDLALWKADHLFHCDENTEEEKSLEPNLIAQPPVPTISETTPTTATVAPATTETTVATPAVTPVAKKKKKNLPAQSTPVNQQSR